MKLHEITQSASIPVEDPHSDIREWLSTMKIDGYTIHPNGVVDVYDCVNLDNKKLKEIPIQFGHVTGNFDISHNNLTSLKGCPLGVNGWFDCRDNPNLTDILKHVFAPNFKLGGKLYVGMPTARSKVHPEPAGGRLIYDIINKHLPSKDLMGCVEEICQNNTKENDLIRFCGGLK